MTPESSDSGERAADAHSAGQRSPFWWFFTLVLAAVIARFAIQWGAPIPACGFRQLTTLPCPLCGGTRALSSAAQFDLLEAVRFNPLVVLAAGLMLAWTVLGLIDLARPRPLVPRLNRWLARHHVWWIIAALTAVNWVYLLFTLP